MDILKGLNTNQKEAVLHTEGPLLILAGAGSGKTRVITHRIAHLIKNNGVKPYNIFAVTFTNKAAEEMKKRVIQIVGPAGNSVFIKTFHSAAVYILRRFGEEIGITRNFTIYDNKDQEAVVKHILIEMKIDPKKFKPSMICSKISEIKDKEGYLKGTDISLLAQNNFSFNFIEIFKKYNDQLFENNALDFNDLLLKTVELFRKSTKALSELQNMWHYFMIDEYQDTNYAQYLIAKTLSSTTNNICVVGDDDQSIYSWRGADIRNILNFEKDYDNAKSITLEENYRSSTQIINAAYSIINNNQQRKPKNVKAFRGEGEKVVWYLANNEYDEGEFVLNTLQSLKLKENLKNSDFAIFYRTNAQSRIFEDVMRKEKIPYRIIGGLKFYDRKEIKDILSYIKFLSNPNDSVALFRIINTPARGIGKSTQEKIMDIAKSEGFSDWKVIDDELLTGRIPKGLVEFKKIINKMQKSLKKVPQTMKLSEFFKEITDISGYRAILSEENSLESNSRLDNIDELINSIYDYEQTYPDATAEQFIQDISLYTSEESPNNGEEDKSNCVTLMTVHNAKGLEFPVVFLTGMEENTFPHKFSIDTEEGIEEERRLCYVGVTRAKDRIFITSTDLRRSFAGVDYKQPSRFINEIPAHCIEIKNYDSSSFGSIAKEKFSSSPSQLSKTYAKERDLDTINSSSNAAFPFSIKSTSTDIAQKKVSLSGSKFLLKEKVIHPKFGVGRVIKIEGVGDNVKLTINFGIMEKVFMEKYTPLEKLN